MKLDNRTDWNTAQLKAIIREVAKREMLGSEELSKLLVRVAHCHKGVRWAVNEVRCRAHRKVWKFWLGCVKGADLDKAFLARTVAWALVYNQGVRAKWEDSAWREKFAWVEQMPLERQQVKAKEKPAADVKVNWKMQHCLEQIIVWEKKAKLADTKLRKWKVKLRYYSKKLAVVSGNEWKVPDSGELGAMHV